MIGDDACTTLLQLLKMLLEIIEKRSNGREKSAKPPKVKVGKLSKRNFKKLMKNGTEMKYVSVPADKLPEIEDALKKLNGSYFNAQLGDNKTAVLAVPANQLDLVNSALKHVVGQTLANDPNSIKVKDGANLIDKEDMGIVNDVLNKYDIPVITFKTADDKYMNVVSSEYEGQYNSAMKEVKDLKKQLDNIEVTRYEQTAPLDDLDYKAYVVTPDEAKELAAAAKAEKLDIDFVRHGDKIAVKYDADISEKVDKALSDYKDSLRESEDYLIDVKDNAITLDVDKLMDKELTDNDSYFMKIPNTSGQDFIRISKEDAELINNGKTLKTELDMDKFYPVYDSSGMVKKEVSGEELAQYFNTKSRFANKDTDVYNYGTGQELNRIELYNSKKNELISMKMDSAENMKIALAEREINSKTIDKLLDDINSKLTDKQKEIFGYTAEKTEIAYADIPNIGEYLAQSQLSQTVIGKAECKGELPKDSGSKCCVMDKNTNSFTVLPVMPVKEVQAALSQMGYSEMSAKEIADKIVRSYRSTDLEKPKEEKIQSSDLKDFDVTNAQLRDMAFVRNGDSTMIIQESDDSYKYMQFDRRNTLSDVEKSLADDFNLDSISVAIAVKCLMKENAIIEEMKTKEHGEAEIGDVTSKVVEITNKENGKSVLMPKDNISTEKLLAIGISAKTAEEIKHSFEKSIKEISSDKQTLGGLIRYAAAEKAKEIGQAVKEKVQSIGKGQER
ncbi:MAG: hypothetical protein ACI4I1_10380 [Oscillospiraceae bacterium]